MGITTMKRTPPHLPPRHTNEFLKQRRQSLAWLVLFIVLSLMASVAASLATLAWIAPPYAQSPLYTFPAQSISNDRTPTRPLDSIVSQQIDQRIVEIYDTRNKLGGKFYAENALVGQALMLSSDGWAVMYASAFPLRVDALEAVNHQGVSFAIAEHVIDEATGLVYVKLRGEGFRSDITFQDWKSFSAETPVWAVRSGSQTAIRMTEVFPDVSDVVGLSELTASYVPSDTTQSVVGDIVVNEQGQLVGVMGEGDIILGWKMSSQMKTIFENSTLTYPEIPWRGRVLTGIQSETTVKSFIGFFVTESPTRASTSTLGAGDVITKINGESFDLTTAGRDIALTRDAIVEVTVIRRDKELTLPVALTVLTRR